MAHRAYEIYMERISRGPLDDWLEAEREIASHKPAEVSAAQHLRGRGRRFFAQLIDLGTLA